MIHWDSSEEQDYQRPRYDELNDSFRKTSFQNYHSYSSFVFPFRKDVTHLSTIILSLLVYVIYEVCFSYMRKTLLLLQLEKIAFGIISHSFYPLYLNFKIYNDGWRSKTRLYILITFSGEIELIIFRFIRRKGYWSRDNP